MDQTVQTEDVTLQIRLEREDGGPATGSETDRLFRMTVEAKRGSGGAPLAQWWPGAWIDWSIDPLSGSVPVCGQRIARYLGGSLLSRPLVDLTGSYVVTLDQEPSLSVLDPSVNFAGRSSLYRSIPLPAPAADWVATPDDRWMMVAVPEARRIVVVEAGPFTIARQIERPRRPVRIAVQPNSRLVWISEVEERSHDHARDHERQGWLTAVDTATWSVVESFPVGEGSPLVAFASNDSWVYAVSPSARRLTIVDARRMVVHRTVSLDFAPTGLVAAPHDPVFWLVDGKKGRVVRVDAEGRERDRLAVAPALEWASISPDGRWVLVATPPAGLTAIPTTPPHRMVTIPLAGRAAELLWSDRFVYVLIPDQRTLSLFSWPSLGQETTPVKSVAIGDRAWGSRPAFLVSSTMALMRTARACSSPIRLNGRFTPTWKG
jgi:DNA-binding beta-propeller fold protein YncE